MREDNAVRMILSASPVFLLRCVKIPPITSMPSVGCCCHCSGDHLPVIAGEEPSSSSREEAGIFISGDSVESCLVCVLAPGPSY